MLWLLPHPKLQSTIRALPSITRRLRNTIEKRLNTMKLGRLKKLRTMRWQHSAMPSMPSTTVRKPPKATPSITPKAESSLACETGAKAPVHLSREVGGGWWWSGLLTVRG